MRAAGRLTALAGYHSVEFGPVATRTAWLSRLGYWDVRHVFKYHEPTRCLTLGRLTAMSGPNGHVEAGLGDDRILAHREHQGHTVALAWSTR